MSRKVTIHIADRHVDCAIEQARDLLREAQKQEIDIGWIGITDGPKFGRADLWLRWCWSKEGTQSNLRSYLRGYGYIDAFKDRRNAAISGMTKLIKTTKGLKLQKS